jgi:hypothetical protein
LGDAVTGRGWRRRSAPGPALAAGALAAAALLVAASARDARADDETLVRVLSEEAQVRTGPGFAFRTIYLARRDEVLPAIDRATRGNWLRVRLPDGTTGWLLGDQVFPLDIEASDTHRGPSLLRRIGDAIFSPSPLLEGRFALTFSAGVLGGDGMFLFRPALLFEPHISLEAFIGESIGNQADIIFYGGGLNVFLFPTSPVTPFLGAAGGGASRRPKADQVVLGEDTFAMTNVGGGLIVAFKKRITLRGDARHYVIFDPNYTQRMQEYSGALNITF